jgi:superfamily II DNA or RNA helicase
VRLRRYRLDEARDAVVRAARFRRPQREAFDKTHEIIDYLDDDIPSISQERLISQLEDYGLRVPSSPPVLVYNLATGVGKTKLMGAVIAYLHKAGQTNNVLILAPRAAILEKLEREAQANSPKYLFLDPSLQPEPRLCFRSNVETFTPDPDGLNVFILSPQSITGKDKRVARASEFRGFSLLEYLKDADDLIVFVDETHHLAAAGEDPAAWTKAIRELEPRLQFGLSATPRLEEGVNIVHSYDLATCLREGKYTKAVELIVEPADQSVSEDDWDHYTVDFALKRLDRKRSALKALAETADGVPFVEPVLLLSARDTKHAEEIAAWLGDRRGLSDEEVLVTHSERSRTEEDIKRLTNIDKPGNTVRVVVNVFQLSEGWDVTNVFVIAPLRAMATFQGAIQTMGRGLRLPAGQRVGNLDIDTLDVLCFGRETAGDILTAAMERFGKADEGGPAVDVKSREEADKEAPPATKEFEIGATRPVAIEIPRVERVPADPELDFDIGDAGRLTKGGATAIDLATLQTAGLEDAVSYEFEGVLVAATSRIIAELSYLSAFKHQSAVRDLVKRFLESLGAQPGTNVAVDPVKVAKHVADEIHSRYRRRTASYRVIGEAEELNVGGVVWMVPEDFDKPATKVPLEEWR